MARFDSHRKYVAWLRLTHNGRLSRAEMTVEDRTEYDSWGLRSVTLVPEPMSDDQISAAKSAYEEAV